MAYTTIKKPSSYFNTKLYTGNGGTNNITGVGFQPDWTWTKDRNGGAGNHLLFDAVRGANKFINSNTTALETTDTDRFMSFDSDGFTLGADGNINSNGVNFASWNWLASNTTASNTDGSITSTVSANTTSGFSIVKYTGTATNPEQIGHGLGVAPKVIFLKALGGAENWFVDISALTGTTNHFLHLNLSNAAFTTTNGIQNIGSSTFDINGPGGHINSNGFDFIAYCFAEKQGFSKFGSYTGNGSTDGTFVYTGFKPAFLIWKQTNAAGEAWGLFDNKRDPYNFVSLRLPPNATDTEGSPSAAASCDFLSNGFKWRSSFNSRNGSGSTYIYMAFAEEPLVGDNPATAR